MTGLLLAVALSFTGQTYTASVDAQGCLRAPGILTSTLLTNATVTTAGNTVTVQRDAAQFVFRFEPTGIAIEQEGASIEYRLTTNVVAFITTDGQATRDSIGDVQKVVTGDGVFTLNEPFHHTHGRLWPSRLAARGGEPEDKFRYRIEYGVAIEPVELLALTGFRCVGFSMKDAPRIAAGQPARLQVQLRNFGATWPAADVRFRVVDHYSRGRTVAEHTVPATSNLVWELKLDTPGFYWVNADIVAAGKPWKTKQIGLLYDADNYRPPLTRPADFHDFWAAKLRAMRAIPFDARLTEVPAKGNERYRHFDLDLAGPTGERLQTFLRVPRAPGPHDAEVVSHWSSTPPDKLQADFAKWEKQPVGVTQWHRGADRIRVGAPQPDDSKYTRWVSRDDNNYLDSYLMNVRMADYLRSRDDVKGIWMFGASRSGASMLAATALAPERVVALDAHVPTSCGISWRDKRYHGWGIVPPAADAPYFDPVNFAPDLTAPVIMDGGFYDGLAPASGILAFHNWATRAPFRRCAIELAGHGYFTSGNRKQMEADLREFLSQSNHAR